jgi:glutathione S-transferase
MTLLEPRPIGGSVLTVGAYTWHSRTKGLPVETISWRFTDEEIIAFSGQGRVPVLVDGDKVLTGSWTIANCLENNTEGASLFGGPAELALTVSLKVGPTMYFCLGWCV